MVVSPGLKLNWGAVEGLKDTLGMNGVTSNYTYETAPYTWELVQNLKKGKALFTQPPMPIKMRWRASKGHVPVCGLLVSPRRNK